MAFLQIFTNFVVSGSKDKEGKKSKKRDTKDASDESAARKKKKSLLYVHQCSV